MTKINLNLSLINSDNSSINKSQFIVIGAGLAGLLTAAALKKIGHQVLLLDGADFAGGSSRGVYSPNGLVDNGLKNFTSINKNEDEQILNLLSMIIGEKLKLNYFENGPITFKEGELKPFVGFGSHAPDFHKPLSYFLAPKRFNIEDQDGKLLTVHDIVSKLIHIVSDSFQPRMLVTQIISDATGEVNQLMINGSKLIQTSNVIYCGSPRQFNQLFSGQNLTSKIKQKLSKGIYWTALCLDIFHKGEVTKHEEMHLLNGTTQDEIGPCVGLFHHINKDTGIQHSQWITYIDSETAEDAEAVGHVLKKIKRQIKRAYHTALDEIVSERIVVMPFTEAEIDLKLQESGLLPTFKNLWVASGSWSNKVNLWGTLSQISTIFNFEGIVQNKLAPDMETFNNESNTPTELI